MMRNVMFRNVRVVCKIKIIFFGVRPYKKVRPYSCTAVHYYVPATAMSCLPFSSKCENLRARSGRAFSLRKEGDKMPRIPYSCACSKFITPCFERPPPYQFVIFVYFTASM